MFWESVEASKERTLQQMVKEPTTNLDDILHHDYCFQELRVESNYLIEFFTRPDILQELLDRSLFFKPSPDTDPMFQYKVSPRSLGILTMGCRPINNAILTDSELVARLINYLKPGEDSFANDITTGFYKRLIIAMLNTFDTSENLFLDVLEKSKFMEYCFESIHFGAVAELIVRIPTHCTNLDFQKRIFDWYEKDGVANRLLGLYNKETSMEVLENAGFMWSEFNEMQLRHVETADAFTNSLYSEEIVKGLVEQAFPSLEESSPLLINYIAPVLVSFVELNRVDNEPGFKAFPDLYMREPTIDLGDPEFKFQSAIIVHAKAIIQVILKAWEAPIANGLTLTAVSCLRLIRALTNTNHLDTHNELAKVFSGPDTSIFKLLDYAVKNPTSSICNNHIMAIIAHIILSNTEQQHVLIDSLFKQEPTIIGYIIDVLNKYEKQAENEPYLQHLARQSFFLKIGEFINIARSEDCERSVYLNELVQHQSESEKWQSISGKELHSFTESNKTYSLNSSQMSQTINSQLGEIDEVVDNTEKSLQELTINPQDLTS